MGDCIQEQTVNIYMLYIPKQIGILYIYMLYIPKQIGIYMFIYLNK